MARQHFKVAALSTSVSGIIEIDDAANVRGDGKTGLAYNSANLKAYLLTPGDDEPVEIPLVSQTPNGAWVSGGFCQVDAAKAPGDYRFDFPNEAFALGAASRKIVIREEGTTALNIVTTRIDVDLDFNATDARMARLNGILPHLLSPRDFIPHWITFVGNGELYGWELYSGKISMTPGGTEFVKSVHMGSYAVAAGSWTLIDPAAEDDDVLWLESPNALQQVIIKIEPPANLLGLPIHEIGYYVIPPGINDAGNFPVQALIGKRAGELYVQQPTGWRPYYGAISGHEVAQLDSVSPQITALSQQMDAEFQNLWGAKLLLVANWFPAGLSVTFNGELSEGTVLTLRSGLFSTSGVVDGQVIGALDHAGTWTTDEGFTEELWADSLIIKGTGGQVITGGTLTIKVFMVDGGTDPVSFPIYLPAGVHLSRLFVTAAGGLLTENAYWGPITMEDPHFRRVDGTKNMHNVLVGLLARAAGKTSNGDASPLVYKRQDGQAAITMTVDEHGTRTAVTDNLD